MFGLKLLIINFKKSNFEEVSYFDTGKTAPYGCLQLTLLMRHYCVNNNKQSILAKKDDVAINV